MTGIDIHGSGDADPPDQPKPEAATPKPQSSSAARARAFGRSPDQDQVREMQAARREAERENVARDRAVRFRATSQRKAARFSDDYWATVYGDAVREDRLRTRAAVFRERSERADQRRTQADYRTDLRDAHRENVEHDQVRREGERQNPEYWRVNDIRRYGQRGARAARDRDYTEVAIVEREFKKLDAHLTQREKDEPENAEWIGRQRGALRESQAQMAAAKGDNMAPGAGLLGAIGAFKQGPWGMAAKAAADVAIGVVTAPQTIAAAMDGLMAGARPYIDLHRGALDAGRAGGFRGQDLEDALYPGTSVPLWMRRRGLTAESSMGILNTYGIAPGDAETARGTIASIADAQFMPSLGGLGFDRYAKAANLAQTLGIRGTSDELGGPMGYAFSQDAFGSRGADHRNGSLTSYWRDLQRTMTAAVGAGMDRSRVFDTVEGLFGKAASAGGPVDATKLQDFYWRMASSGAPNARTGEAQLSAIQGMQAAIGSAGLGGGVGQNAAISNYFGRRGGMPTTSGGWAKTLGVDPTTLPAALRKQFDLVVEASKTGGTALTTEYLKPFLDADPDLWQRVIAGSGMVPRGPLGPLIAGAISGAGTTGQIEYETGQVHRPTVGTAGSSWNDELYKKIEAAAKRHGIPMDIALGLVAQEDPSGDPTARGRDRFGRPTSSIGLTQIQAGARKDEGLSDADALDPDKNLDAGFDYLAKRAKKAGNWNDALTHYHMGDGGDDGGAYASLVRAKAAQFSNNPTEMNRAIATQGALQMNASRQDYQGAAGMSDAGGMLVKFTGEIGNGTEALRKLVESAFAASRALAGVASTNQTRKPLLQGRANDLRYMMHGRMPA